jgi:hypothetical protein
MKHLFTFIEISSELKIMFLIPSAQIAVILFGGLLLGNRDNILYLYSWLGIGDGFHGPTERLKYVYIPG